MFQNLLNNIVPGVFIGIIAGVIVLLLEYRTKWFANYVPRASNPEMEFYTRRKLFDWIEMLATIVLALMFFWGLFQFMALAEPQPVVLENTSEKSNIIHTIGIGETKPYFGDELFVTVTNAKIQGEESDKTYCNFIIFAPGFQNVAIERAELASVHKFFFNHNYEIRVVRVASFFSSECDLLVSNLDQEQP